MLTHSFRTVSFLKYLSGYACAHLRALNDRAKSLKNIDINNVYRRQAHGIKNGVQIASAADLHPYGCGEKGIRTLGTQRVQRFSRPPRSTTPASLLNEDSVVKNHNAKVVPFMHSAKKGRSEIPHNKRGMRSPVRAREGTLSLLLPFSCTRVGRDTHVVPYA